MFCRNCGAKISDDAVFCTSCGKSVIEEEYEAPVAVDAQEIPVETDEKQQTEVVADGQAAVAQAEVQMPVVSGEAQPIMADVYGQSKADDCKTFDVDITKSKKKIGMIIAAVLAAVGILTVGVLGFALKDPIFFAVSPEKYVGNLVADTFEQMGEEGEQIKENLIGYKLTENDAYTVGVKAEIDEDYEQGMSLEVDAQLANDPEYGEMIFDVDAKGNKNEQKISANAQGFWDDENIGVAIDDIELGEEIPLEKFSGKYFVVPSADFGNAFMNSIFADEFLESGGNIDLSGLDLSYSKVMGYMNEEELKPLKKEIKNKFIILLENSEIGKRESIKYHMGDDEVSAKRIVVTINEKAVCDFAIGVIDAIKSDSYMQEQLGSDMLAELEILSNELKNNRSNMSNSTANVELVEYGGRIVEIDFAEDGYGLIISATDKDYALNGMKFDIVSGGNSETTFEYSSNWVNSADEIFIDASVSEYGSKSVVLYANLDFDRETFNADLSIPGVSSQSVSGKCSKNGGFTLSVDNFTYADSGYIKTNSMEYDEWFDEKYRDEDNKMYSYYTENKNYDDLWDIYYDDYWYDYDSYADWYDDKGRRYDDDYMTYDDWLDETLYETEENLELYEYETGDYEYVDYDVNVKLTLTVKRGVLVQIMDRPYVDVFDLTYDDIEEYEQMYYGTEETETE